MMRSIKLDSSSVNLVSTGGERRMSTGMYVKQVVNFGWFLDDELDMVEFVLKQEES